MIVRFLLRVLGALALIVPQGERGRWREEWLAELEHVARDRGLRTAAGVAAGALPDALAFRKLSAHRATDRISHYGSDQRGFMTSVSWLDVKLGVRMLLKYPGLAVVAVLGMAVAIAIGAGSFAFFYSYMTPTLPLDEGERVVAIENWDAAERAVAKTEPCTTSSRGAPS